VTTFDFRIKCYLPKAQGLAVPTEGAEIMFPDCEKPVKLFSPQPGRDRNSLIISSQGISSKERAEEIGQRTRTSLSLCSAGLQLGIDVGRDAPFSGFSDVRASVRNEVHGLDVFPTEQTRGFISVEIGRPRKTHPLPLERFVSELQKHYERNPGLTAKQQLALELYNSSHYETSEKTRFLTLITAIEVLVKRNRQPEQMQNLITDFIKTIDKIRLKEEEVEHDITRKNQSKHL
jgi:hypothetical protein